MASANTVDARPRRRRCHRLEIPLRITFAALVCRYATADNPIASVLGDHVGDFATLDVLSMPYLRQTQTGDVLGGEIKSALAELLQM
ncbi:hypothetical protein [Neorhodopirellula lusitana]|uniref:hypothetical protein n=1 Tax=Neorhodopirellula lusitana TaxID=445327 RepID=UPI00384F6113